MEKEGLKELNTANKYNYFSNILDINKAMDLIHNPHPCIFFSNESFGDGEGVPEAPCSATQHHQSIDQTPERDTAPKERLPEAIRDQEQNKSSGY